MKIPIPRTELMIKAATEAANEKLATENRLNEILDPLLRIDADRVALLVKDLIDKYKWMDQRTALDIIQSAERSIGAHLGTSFHRLQAEFAEEYVEKHGGVCQSCGRPLADHEKYEDDEDDGPENVQ